MLRLCARALSRITTHQPIGAPSWRNASSVAPTSGSVDSQVIPTDKLLRFGLRPGEAEEFNLGPALLREVSLDNASRAEITQVERRQIAEHFARRKGDTGSPEVQVALLSARIKSLASHIRVHHKDKHSKRGLMGLVAQRKKMVAYMRRTGAEERYLELVKTMPASLS